MKRALSILVVVLQLTILAGSWWVVWRVHQHRDQVLKAVSSDRIFVDCSMIHVGECGEQAVYLVNDRGRFSLQVRIDDHFAPVEKDSALVHLQHEVERLTTGEAIKLDRYHLSFKFNGTWPIWRPYETSKGGERYLCLQFARGPDATDTIQAYGLSKPPRKNKYYPYKRDL